MQDSLTKWNEETTAYRIRTCLDGSGGPQVGEVTHLGEATRLSNSYNLSF